MIKSILTIICFLGLSLAQIQYGGSPNFYQDRSVDISFIQINQNNIVDRNFHPMVFQFGDEYDVDINVVDNATLITNGNINTYLLGLESNGAFALGINFDKFYLTENSKLFLYDEEQTFYMGSFDERNNNLNFLINKIFNPNTINCIIKSLQNR